MVEVGTSDPNSSLSFTNLTGEMASPSLHALRRWLICVTPVRPQHFIVNTPHLPLRSRTYWITEYGGCWEATSLQLPRASEFSQRGDHTLSSGSPRNWQRWSLEDRPRWSKITDVLKLALRCWEQLQSPLFHWHTLAAAPKISTKDHATGVTNHFGNLVNTVTGFVLLGNPTQPERFLVYCK